jgi:predicted negative regulator of RcsB-dependent stress response
MKLLIENWRRFLKENKDDMLSLSFAEFDQPQYGKGWRTIRDPSEQAEVMQKYIDANGNNISAGNLSLLMWHMAQALAYAGNNQKAADTMKSVAKRQQGQSAPEIIDYGLATIAFLEKDTDGLNKIYNKYKDRINKQDSEDMNMNIIGCMKKCAEDNNFNYSDAYQANPSACPC